MRPFAGARGTRRSFSVPRTGGDGARLSAAWHALYAHWAESLDQKVTHSLELIDRTLPKHVRPVVCWSGGKDSTALLHLVRRVCPNVDVIYNDPLVDLPETYAYVERMANEWNLNLHVSKPAKGQDFWSVGKSHGWPIFGKAVSSNVERAIRTGNVRAQLTKLERQLVVGEHRISCRCADSVRTRPGMLVERQLGCDLKIIGLRADESRARVRLWADHGEYFYVKRHFSHREGVWKLNPIARWLEADIWAYHDEYDIPHCALYDMGHSRNGCWTCAMAIRNGQLERLSASHPELFRELVVDSPMSVELLRARDFWCGRPPRHRYTKGQKAEALETYHEVFARGWHSGGRACLTRAAT